MSVVSALVAICTLLGQTRGDAAGQQPDYVSRVASHLDRMMSVGLDRYGPEHSGLWLASIDLRQGGCAEDKPAHLRWYRDIYSPRGSNLYWDLPLLEAAYEVSRLTGRKRYARGADQYLRCFLQKCAGTPSGLFQWGNHIYYDVFTDRVVGFSGSHHECRPHTPTWDRFWSLDPQRTERAIVAIGQGHVCNPESGLFCRHADVRGVAVEAKPKADAAVHSFLEAGGVIVESLCWLAARKESPERERLIELAHRTAAYSFAQRDARSGLLRNQPNKRRWDYETATSEVGLWAGCLLRAAARVQDDRFQAMAAAAVRAWVTAAYDERRGMYFGTVNVEDAAPREFPPPRGYWPPKYAEVFDLATRPTHNYPMPMAEACLTLYQRTQEEVFRQAVARWIGQVERSLPANGGQGACAEDYGRAIHFLVRAAQELDDTRARGLAQQVAEESVRLLYAGQYGMFRSHPGEDRCDAVDGPGILMLALIYLQNGSLGAADFGF